LDASGFASPIPLIKKNVISKSGPQHASISEKQIRDDKDFIQSIKKDLESNYFWQISKVSHIFRTGKFFLDFDKKQSFQYNFIFNNNNDFQGGFHIENQKIIDCMVYPANFLLSGARTNQR
jgi:hypothetical protein